MAFENLFIRTKRTLGGIQLDSVILEEHDSSVTTTENPVEAGADITDHSIIEPSLLFIKGVVTDTPLGTAAFGLLVDSLTGLFGTSTRSNITRSQQAYEAIEILKNRREPIEVNTKLKVYNNMLIQNVKVSQDKDTSRSAILDITLKEIFITESATLSLEESDVISDYAKATTAPIEKGRQEVSEVAENVNSSVLNTISGWLGG